MWLDLCPFSGSVRIDAYVGEEYLGDYRDIRWTVTKPPELEFAVDGSVVTVRETTPGKVKLSMTATRQVWTGDDFADADDVTITTTCRTRADTLVLTVGAEGTWTVTHIADAGTVPSVFAYQPAETVDTCGSGND